jgi:hypothetical protein
MRQLNSQEYLNLGTVRVVQELLQSCRVCVNRLPRAFEMLDQAG